MLIATADEEVLLEGAAAAVWECLAPPCDEEELARRCEVAFELPPAATRDALGALHARGLCGGAG